MFQTFDIDEIASTVLSSVRLLVQRLRESRARVADVTSPEISALARIERAESISSAELARLERISPQSIGATIATLELRGFVRRDPDPADGRKLCISLTQDGSEELRRYRRARSDRISHALETEFTKKELEQLRQAAPLLERLANRL